VKIVWYSSPGRRADNPRALHERFLARGDVEAEHVWIAGPQHAATFPAGTTTVALDSPEAVAALEAADLVVADNHLPRWTKRPGTTHLQTWHGTPMKRIHRDARTADPAGEEVLRILDEDVTRWDLLLAPSEAAGELLRSAFRYPGPVRVTGYPRNDGLLAEDAAVRREHVRTALGVAEDRTAVLYMPTWRDDDRDGEGPDFRLALDLERFRARLGADHVLLLRLHHFVAGALPPLDGPGVLDVSQHPDVSDLYLAADVLVTDYSSALFDFALTGKPVVGFAYDLEHYRDDVRGFYVDPEESFPGPLVRESEEVFDALADLEGLRVEFKERYADFQERFCGGDDGVAADRVLDLVLLSSDADRELSRAAPR
jgi:CDP-glycerol glycerophosphotransferase